jgi:hypothetical protein
MDLSELADALLGFPGLLPVLVEHVPQIAKIQELSSLRNLKPERIGKVDKSGDQIEVDLEATATCEDFYYGLKEELEQAVGNYFHSVVMGRGGVGDEHKFVSFTFPIGVTGRLRVYNPKYRNRVR